MPNELEDTQGVARIPGHLPAWPNFGAHIVFIAFAVLGGATGNETVHKYLAPFGFLVLCAYIVALFGTLG